MPNAIEMLREDHRKVKELFEEFEHTEQSQAKEQIVKATVQELEVHAALEEEMFYPAAEEQIDEKESVLFPKLEGKLNAEGLGTEMEARKQQLQQQPRKHSRAKGGKSRQPTRRAKA